MDELRECPFCGNPAQRWIDEDDFMCCGCRGCEHTYYGELGEKLWNTRPLEDALRAEIEQLHSDLSVKDVLIEEFQKSSDHRGIMLTEAKAQLSDALDSIHALRASLASALAERDAAREREKRYREALEEIAHTNIPVAASWYPIRARKALEEG